MFGMVKYDLQAYIAYSLVFPQDIHHNKKVGNIESPISSAASTCFLGTHARIGVE